MRLSDLSKVEEAPVTLISPGTYVVTVTDAEESESSVKKTPCIALDMEIMSGDFKGRGLKDWLYKTPKAEWRIAQFLKAVGVEIPEGEFELNPASLIGRKCAVKVKHEIYNGDVKTRCDRYEPVDDSDVPAPVDESDVPF